MSEPLFGPEKLLVGIYPPYTVLEVGSYTQQSVVSCSSVYGADAYTPSHSSTTTIKYLSTNHCFRSGLSNSVNSTKQCYCYKMYQLVKEKEPSAGNDAGSQKVHNHLGVTKRKVESCDTAETTCQSLKIINNDKSGSTRQRITVHAVTQSHPSPVLSLVESVPQGAHITHIKVDNSDKRAHNEPSSSKVLQDVHISGQLMEDFLELAKDNTDKDLETCGVLGAFLENRTFYVTTLIIPKQDSTSSSCQAVNEEEVFAIQNERSLFPVGWIHTHPSQSCFMSSIDLHTQYSYQAMVPEAFAIVVAPTDSSRSSGIFRLTDPCGMSVLKNCQEDGFHPHKEPADGSPIYENCSNVYTNSNLRFEIFDLR